MRLVLMFAIACGFVSSDAFAQTKRDGITYINVTEAQCLRECGARGWSAADCKPFCRPGSCRKAKTGSEHFCVLRK